MQWPGSGVINETQICRRGARCLLGAEMPPRSVVVVTHRECNMSGERQDSFLAVWKHFNASNRFLPELDSPQCPAKCPAVSDITDYLTPSALIAKSSYINHRLCNTPLNICTRVRRNQSELFDFGACWIAE